MVGCISPYLRPNYVCSEKTSAAGEPEITRENRNKMAVYPSLFGVDEYLYGSHAQKRCGPTRYGQASAGMEERTAVLFRLLRSEDPSAIISFFRDLTANFDVNLTFDEEGFSAVHKIAQANNEELCRVFLLEVGEDLDVNLRSRNAGRCTALHLAAATGDNFVVDKLLQRGAATACLDGYGQSPFDVAMRHGHLATAFILLKESESI